MHKLNYFDTISSNLENSINKVVSRNPRHLNYSLFLYNGSICSTFSCKAHIDVKYLTSLFCCWSRQNPIWVLVCSYFYRFICCFFLSPTITAGLSSRPSPYSLAWLNLFLLRTILCPDFCWYITQMLYVKR